MSKASKSKLIVVGAIKGAHGVRGDIRVKSFTADPEAVFDYGPLVDENGLELFEPVSARAGKDHFIVKPREMRQKEEWDALRGTLLYVSRDALPDAAEDEFYIEDLIGLDVFSGGDSAAGRVRGVQNFGADDLIEVQVNGLSHTVLVPFTRVDVPTIDISAGRVIIPELDAWSETTDKEE